MDGEDILFW